jgi:hypothetical protein
MWAGGADDAISMSCRAHARAINTTLLDTERVGQGCVLASPAFERIARPIPTEDGRRAPALRLGDPRVHALAGTRCTSVLAVTGITNKSLRTLVTGLLGGATYTWTQASYDLARLRINGLITRIPGKNRYRLTGDGLRLRFSTPNCTTACCDPCSPPTSHPHRNRAKRVASHRHSYPTNRRQGPTHAKGQPENSRQLSKFYRPRITRKALAAREPHNYERRKPTLQAKAGAVSSPPNCAQGDTVVLEVIAPYRAPDARFRACPNGTARSACPSPGRSGPRPPETPVRKYGGLTSITRHRSGQPADDRSSGWG